MKFYLPTHIVPQSTVKLIVQCELHVTLDGANVSECLNRVQLSENLHLSQTFYFDSQLGFQK